MDEPRRVTGYIAWLHILAATLIDDDHRIGVTGIRYAIRGGLGRPGLPAVLDWSALPLDRP